MAYPLVILGAVGNCFDIVDAARASGEYDPIGFLDDDTAKHGIEIYGLPVLGALDKAATLERVAFVNGIGSSRAYRLKEGIIGRLGLDRTRFVTVVHPAATMSSSSQLGAGVVVLACVSIGANVVVGDHVMILPNCAIGHDTKIGDFVTMAAGVTVSGNVTIGRSCYVGAGAAIRDGVGLGDGALLGVGAVQVADLLAGGVYAGNPARVMSA